MKKSIPIKTLFNLSQGTSSVRKDVIHFVLIEGEVTKIICTRFFPADGQLTTLNDIALRAYQKRRRVNFSEGVHHVTGYAKNIVLRKVQEEDGLVFYLENQDNQIRIPILNALEVNLLLGSLKSAEKHAKEKHEKL
jgi:hypothetical protein